MARTSYAIALGSNRRHGRHGGPVRVVAAAIEALAGIGDIEGRSTIRATPALGPAGRAFANAAIILITGMEPEELIESLKGIERSFGRRGGRRWGPRVLDLDIILWSGGAFAGPSITIPHPEYRQRRFVLEPLVEIAPRWRDPIHGATPRHSWHRLRAPRTIDPPDSRF